MSWRCFPAQAWLGVQGVIAPVVGKPVFASPVSLLLQVHLCTCVVMVTVGTVGIDVLLFFSPALNRTLAVSYDSDCSIPQES